MSITLGRALSTLCGMFCSFKRSDKYSEFSTLYKEDMISHSALHIGSYTTYMKTTINYQYSTPTTHERYILVYTVNTTKTDLFKEKGIKGNEPSTT